MVYLSVVVRAVEKDLLRVVWKVGQRVAKTADEWASLMVDSKVSYSAEMTVASKGTVRAASMVEHWVRRKVVLMGCTLDRSSVDSMAS